MERAVLWIGVGWFSWDRRMDKVVMAKTVGSIEVSFRDDECSN